MWFALYAVFDHCLCVFEGERMDNDSYRHGFEAALELCITEVSEADTREKALVKMTEFLQLVKEDKIERLKEMLWCIKK